MKLSVQTHQGLKTFTVSLWFPFIYNKIYKSKKLLSCLLQHVGSACSLKARRNSSDHLSPLTSDLHKSWQAPSSGRAPHGHRKPALLPCKPPRNHSQCPPAAKFANASFEIIYFSAVSMTSGSWTSTVLFVDDHLPQFSHYVEN